MKIAKWIVFFLFSFVVSWAVISTLSQVAFSMAAPARVLFYKTPEFPMYAYIVGAFFLGLVLGLALAAYNFISLKSQSIKQGNRIRRLEQENEQMKARRGDDTGEEGPAEAEMPAALADASDEERLLDDHTPPAETDDAPDPDAKV
ncbi:MAG: DUF1049 domain-containing protein [Chitinivibrionales bacterium]|nr:DUF1049 domain-containing protein [Chitinivibrionales bacterium]MBD3396730.1 DUF1049 domain-containing protein [Chitinivibrionales bacterium]